MFKTMSNKINKSLVIFLIATVFSFAFGQKKAKLEDGIYANFTTSKGLIVVKLYADQTPMTVANFIGLAEGKFEFGDKKFAKPYYDGLKFHRVISKTNGDQNDFMVQGGDPEGTGAGGPGYKFYDEIVPSLKHDRPGILSMANAGANTNGSQFFITLVPTPWLDGKHTVFGEVIQGLDIVNLIVQNDLIKKLEIQRVGKEYSAKKWISNLKFMEGYSVQKAAEEAEVKRIENLAKMDQEEYKKYSFENVQKNLATITNNPAAVVKQSETGLSYIILNEGTGEKVKAGDNVSLHYTGKLMDGKIFDSSVGRGAPMDFIFKQQGMIPGFEEGVSMLGKGGKAIIIIPYFSAYGPMGIPNVIPPYSDLIFELEIVDLK